MATLYHLATCNTCQRIIEEWAPGPAVELREIKSQPLSETEVDHLRQLAGSYEALFSRRARKFRQWGLHDQNLGEDDYRRYLLADYTFLKRPVLVVGNQIFIGNAKAQVAAGHAALQEG